MFRKPAKRKNKQALRRKESEDDHQEETSLLLNEARKKIKKSNDKEESGTSDSLVPRVQVGADAGTLNTKDLVTSVAEHHPDQKPNNQKPNDDGIFRDTSRNAFHAGPIRAASHIRVTARFDYQPDICKDYKETGFCGFGDTCIYLHDRGDTLTGWQLEQQWQEQQEKKKQEQERQLQKFMGKTEEDDEPHEDDGLPFACYLCRAHFKEPVVTTCQHYFCQACIIKHVQAESNKCPICQTDTHSVFNEPSKLLSKLRKVLGSRAAKQEDAWEVFFAQKGQKTKTAEG